jgi:hypothetical protein
MTDLPDPIDAERLALADELREIAGKLINGDVEDGSVPVAKLCKAADLLEEPGAPRRDEPGGPVAWRYQIQRGPDGEEAYAWVFDDKNNLVCTAKTHHAKAIVGAFAHPAASQGGVLGCGVPGCNDPTCDYGHEPAPSRPAAQPMREKVVALILSAMISQRDPDIFGASHAKKMNRQVAEKFADAILSLAPASANEVKHV